MQGDWKIQPASAELVERVKKIEENVIVFNQRLWAIESRLDELEEKKSYTEQARQYAKDRE